MINDNQPVITSYNSPNEVPAELDPNAIQTYNYMVRQKRNQLLKNSDIYVLQDFPITPQNLIIIKTYRQALRDTPENNFIFPTPPDFIT